MGGISYSPASVIYTRLCEGVDREGAKREKDGGGPDLFTARSVKSEFFFSVQMPAYIGFGGTWLSCFRIDGFRIE